MNGAADLSHLIVAPVLLPLATAAVLIGMGDRWRSFKVALNSISMVLSLCLAAFLVDWAGGTSVGTVAVYLPGNWPVPMGIVLALDRLSALMLVLAALAALASLMFSLARWHRASVSFHPLLQLQLMGLNGAFLTADLFNLFVFFEVLLAASYGLLLHGGGAMRVRAGLHYIAINLLASLLFLLGVSLLYGLTGTLNMADIARKLPLVPTGDLGLLHAAAALLGVAFLVKAALWPLNFWLPPAYAAASAPASAMFAILTKVGIYAVLRLWTLCFPDTAGASALFGHQVLLWGGLATMAFGAVGMLGSQHLGRLASYAVITSSGTVLAAVSLDVPALTAGALFYMASSTLAAAALFLLVELVERSRQVEVDPPSPDEREDRLPMFGERVSPLDANLDDQQVVLVGRAFPAALVYLGLTFLVCTMVLSGLPPLSGFIGKVAMLSALLEVRGSLSERWPAAAWSFFGLVFVSGLLAAVALTRAFIAHFWALQERAAPRLRVAEGVPVALLLGGCLAMAVGAESTLQYMRITAAQLHSPQHYIDAMLRAQPHTQPHTQPHAPAAGQPVSPTAEPRSGS